MDGGIGFAIVFFVVLYALFFSAMLSESSPT